MSITQKQRCSRGEFKRFRNPQMLGVYQATSVPDAQRQHRESQCTEDEHDDEDDSKFRNLGLVHCVLIGSGRDWNDFETKVGTWK